MYNYVRQHLSNNVKHLTSTISLEICSQIKKGLKKVNKISLRIFSELCLCLACAWCLVMRCGMMQPSLQQTIDQRPIIHHGPVVSPERVTSSGPLVGWPGRKPGCDWLLAGYQCPLSNNDGSLPDSVLSAELPGIVLSAISRHPPLSAARAQFSKLCARKYRDETRKQKCSFVFSHKH